jgi:Helix-turn-helix domain
VKRADRSRAATVQPSGRQLYKIVDAMVVLSMSRSVIYEQIRSGRLRSVTQGRSRLVPASAIADYIALLEHESRVALWLADAAVAMAASRGKPPGSAGSRPSRSGTPPAESGSSSGPLKRAITRAEARDKVKRNVVLLCDTPQGRRGRPSKSLTLAQAEALLKAAENTSLYAYIVVSLLTGARTEELRPLTWSHVELNADPTLACPSSKYPFWSATAGPRPRRPFTASRSGRSSCAAPT